MFLNELFNTSASASGAEEAFSARLEMERAGIRTEWSRDPSTRKSRIDVRVPVAVNDNPEVTEVLDRISVSAEVLRDIRTEVIDLGGHCADVGAGYYMDENGYHDLPFRSVIGIAITGGASMLHEPIEVVNFRFPVVG